MATQIWFWFDSDPSDNAVLAWETPTKSFFLKVKQAWLILFKQPWSASDKSGRAIHEIFASSLCFIKMNEWGRSRGWCSRRNRGEIYFSFMTCFTLRSNWEKRPTSKFELPTNLRVVKSAVLVPILFFLWFKKNNIEQILTWTCRS